VRQPRARRRLADADLGPVPGLGFAHPVSVHPLIRLEGDDATDGSAPLAEEVPVAMVYNGRSHVVVLASPTDLEDLALGFSVTEGIVSAAANVRRVEVIKHSRGIELHLSIPDDDAARLDDRRRGMTARTGCGLCGVEAIDDILRDTQPVESELLIEPDALWRAAAALDANQPLNRETHALHAAAWATADGTLHVVREDVGRHNALDKVLGGLARTGVDPATGFLVITSRASYELVQKVAVSRVALLAAVSRPTTLAVKLSDALGVTLVALLRGQTANVYSRADRIRSPAAVRE
jgi:formate dehydrogenase accessory protein FdhD